MNPTLHRIRRLMRPLEGTPLHPQWLVLGHRAKIHRMVAARARGVVLDIGAGNAGLRDAVQPPSMYVALDYPATRSLGYEGRVSLYGDACALPIRSGSVDVVCLFDVLEHLLDPARALDEVARALKPDGICLLHVPFIYPIHDAPHDYLRWTRHGLQSALRTHGIEPLEISETTTAIESAAALLAMALAQSIAQSFRRLGAATILAPVAALAIPVINGVAWALARALPGSAFMTFSYLVVGQRSNEATEYAGELP